MEEEDEVNVPRPEWMTQDDVRHEQQRVPGKLRSIQVLELPLQSHMRLACYGRCQGMLVNPALGALFRAQADDQGMAPPVFELPKERLVTLARPAEHTPAAYRAALETHGIRDATDTVIDELMSAMGDLRVGESTPQPMPFWPAAMRERPAMVVPDADGNIAAASWQQSMRYATGGSMLFYLLPLFVHKCAMALELTLNDKPRLVMEWDIRVDADTGVYTLYMRATTVANTRRRGFKDNQLDLFDLQGLVRLSGRV